MKIQVSLSGSKRDTLIRLYEDIVSAPAAKKKSIEDAVYGIGMLYNSSEYMGNKISGRMLVESARQNYFELSINALRWLSKNYFTDVTTGFTTVYRLHSIHKNQKSKLKVGKVCKFKPLRPVLSWTALEKPYVAHREDMHHKDYIDCILSRSVKPVEVVWSYKIKAWREAIKAFYLDLRNGKFPAEGERDDHAYRVINHLDDHSNSMFSAEKEVTLYLPDQFNATLVKTL